MFVFSILLVKLKSQDFLLHPSHFLKWLQDAYISFIQRPSTSHKTEQFCLNWDQTRDKATYKKKHTEEQSEPRATLPQKTISTCKQNSMQQATEKWFQIRGHTIKPYKWQRFQTQLLHTNAPFTRIKEFQWKCLPKTWDSDIHSIWWFCYFACSVIYQPRGEEA